MKKKILFLKEKEKLEIGTELYNIFLEELSKASRIEINYFEPKGKFRFESYICENISINRIVRDINDLSYERSLSFYYIVEQELPKLRKLNENNIGSLFNDIISIFDKRKINQCFNYEIEDSKKEKIIKECIKIIFKDKLDEEEKKILKEIMIESITIDKHLYEDIKKSKMKIKFFEKKIKELKKMKIFEKIEILKNFEKKYSLLNFSLEGNKGKRIELRDVDFSELQTIFPKKNRFFSKKIFKNKLEKGGLTFEELILDESYNNFFALEFEYFNNYLAEVYGSKMLKKSTQYKFSKYLERDGGLLEKYKKNKEHYLKFDYTEIGEKVWEGIKIDDFLIEEMILINDKTEFRYRIELMEIFENIYNSPCNKEEVIKFRKKILEKYSGNILDIFEKECQEEINYRVNRDMNKIYNFEKILSKRTLNRIENKDIGLVRFFPKNIEKYFRKNYKDVEELVEKRTLEVRKKLNKYLDINISEDKFLNIIKEDNESSNDELEAIIDILNKDITISNKNDILKELSNEFKKLKKEVIESINVDIIDIQKILKIIYDPIPIMQETITIYLDYEEIKKIKQIVGVELKNKFGANNK